MIVLAVISLIPEQDTYLSELNSDLCYGGSPYLYIASSAGSGNGFQTLIRYNSCNNFFQNSIPSDSVISLAELDVYVSVNQIPVGESITLNIAPVLEAWDDAVITWNNKPQVASAIVTATIASGFFGTISVGVTNLVNEWYTGSLLSNGILLSATSSGNWLIGFNSRESPNTAFWPRLNITYSQYFYTST
ncbi:MAG: DNRLRE domain-containing protein [Chitinophagales bacterium]